VLDCVLEVLNDPLFVNDTDTVVQPELLMVLDWLTVSVDPPLADAVTPVETLEDTDGEMDRLLVPDTQIVVVTEGVEVVEREGVRVVEGERVEVRVGVVDTVGLPLGARELVSHEVGECEGGTEAVALEEGEGEGVKEEAGLGVAPPP
jgi:hypothetical protein